MDWYIDLHLQWDPHPFLFRSPARYVASCSLLLHNRLTSDPLPVAESTRPPAAAPPAVALTAGKDLSGEPAPDTPCIHHRSFRIPTRVPLLCPHAIREPLLFRRPRLPFCHHV